MATRVVILTVGVWYTRWGVVFTLLYCTFGALGCDPSSFVYDVRRNKPWGARFSAYVNTPTYNLKCLHDIPTLASYKK